LTEDTRDLAVAIRGLYKHFGQVPAVNGVDLDVRRGSFFGLVGPNGAGKTTTLAMVTGLLRPDAGVAWVAGFYVWSDPVEAKRRMGILPEGLRLFDRLSGRELLLFSGALRGMDPDEVATRADELLDVFELREASGQLVADYSTGMRKKIGLAVALLHNPPVLFLDEPFEAVDPISARTIREVLAAFTARGGTVVFSSHVMELVERLCDEVAVMIAGRIVAAGPLGELTAGRSLDEVFIGLAGRTGDRRSALTWLDGG